MANGFDVLEAVKRVENIHLLTIVAVAMLLAPGIFILILFFPELLKEFDIFKILLICLTAGMATLLPSFFTISVAAFGNPDSKIPDEFSNLSLFILSILLMSLLAFGPLMWAFFASITDFKFFLFVYSLATVAIPVAIFIIIAIYQTKQPKKK